MPELKKIDGINVLFLDTDKELSNELLKHDKEKIGLVVIGHGMENFTELLAGRNLTDYISTETTKVKKEEESKPLTLPEILRNIEPIPIRTLPQFETPFFPKTLKPHKQQKWYEGKRKRKK